MKKILILLSLLISLSSFSQVKQDTITHQHYKYNYIDDQIRYEKNKLMWTLVGGLAYGGIGAYNYYRNGNQSYLFLNTGLSVTVSLHSIYKLTRLKKGK